MDIFFISVVCFLSGVVFFVVEIVNKQDFDKLLAAILLICIGAYNSITNSQIFDEISSDDYIYMKKHKSICLKYEDCKKYYYEIFDNDGVVRRYEFKNLVQILDETPEVKEEIEKMKELLRK